MKVYGALVMCGMVAGCSTRLIVPTQYLPVPALCEDEAADLSVLTYNVGLAPGIVPMSIPRVPYVAAAVADHEADIICLQEVWTENGLRAVRDASGFPADRFFHEDTSGEGETGTDVCTDDQIDRIAACMDRECTDLPEEEQTICAVERCRDEGIPLYLFGRGCLNCLIASAGMAPDAIRNRCVREGGGSRLYGGRNGIVLMSRWPLLDREAIRLPSSGANRVALLATIGVPGKGSVEVACTHISSSGPLGPTHPDFGSWDDEKMKQFRMIARRLRERAGHRPMLLVGDANFSRADAPAMDDSSPEVWITSLEEGFMSPAAFARPGFCTSCPGNTLRRGSSRHMIDHVMVRDEEGGMELFPRCASREFLRTVSIEAHGRTVVTHLSDHFGTLVRFRIHPGH